MQKHEIKLHKVTIDITKHTGMLTSTDIVYFTGDINTSVIQVKLLNEDKVVNLDGYDVTATIIRSNRNYLVEKCNTIDVENGVVELILSSSSLASGVNYIELVLMKEGSQIVVPTISYKIVNAFSDILNSEIINANEYPILTELIDNVNKLEDRVNLELPTLVDDKIESIKSELKGEKGDTPSIVHIEDSIYETIKNITDEFNKLLISKQQDAEVIMARESVDGKIHENLKSRLDFIELQPSIVWETVEG